MEKENGKKSFKIWNKFKLSLDDFNFVKKQNKKDRKAIFRDLKGEQKNKSPFGKQYFKKVSK